MSVRTATAHSSAEGRSRRGKGESVASAEGCARALARLATAGAAAGTAASWLSGFGRLATAGEAASDSRLTAIARARTESRVAPRIAAALSVLLR